MKTFVLPENVRDALLDYLAQRPWREVEQAMHALMSLREMPTPSPDMQTDGQ